jgi:hypothetical protein
MKIRRIIDIALKAIALAMGIAVAVLSVLNKVEIKSAINMLGIGLACLTITQFSEKKKERSRDFIRI